MNKRDIFKALLVNKTALIEGVTPTSVRRVMNDLQNNDEVFDTFCFLEEEINKAVDHVKLVRDIERETPLEIYPIPQNI